MRYLILSFFLLSLPLQGQEKFTVEDIYTGLFQEETVENVNWMNDGRYYTALEDNLILKYDATSGQISDTLLDANSLDTFLLIDEYTISPDERKILLLTEKEMIYRRSFLGNYFVFDLDSASFFPLSPHGHQSYATFSPDASKIAFTRQNNIFIHDLTDFSEIQITLDGEFNKVINGSTDWVYEEEFSFTKAFFWSPDSKKLAYYRFDESQVREYNMQVWNNGQLYPKDYKFKYPKAGEKNSEIQIWAYHLNSDKKVEIDLGGEKDIYIRRIQWVPNQDIISIERFNRLQNQMDLLHADPSSGKSSLILSENAKEYIESRDDEMVTYLTRSKQFLLISDRDGYDHLYLFGLNGKLIRQVTSGSWEVTRLIGLDEKYSTPLVYFLSTEGSPLERQFFRADIKGQTRKQLSIRNGVNDVEMSPDFKYFILYNHSAESPLEVSLYQTSNNQPILKLKANKFLKSQAKKYGLVTKEFFSYPTQGGDEINGYLLKPIGFDPRITYPLLIYQYSGPGSQEVENSWNNQVSYWHQLLVKEGYIVACIDTRGTGGRGSAFKKITYKQLGKYETIDLIEGAKYLGSQSYIDPNRIGIWGWSYGGYISSLCMLKGADYFKTGIAVAPVTSWRFYDTIYTERYLQRPQDNPEGYDDNSPINFAHLLKGNFLLIHGTGDDNVHFQNSVTFQDALITAGKKFESFYYPDRSHSISEGGVRIHLFEKMTDYILENL